MRIILTCLILIAFQATYAQAIKHIQWASNPKLHTIDEKYKDAAAVYVLDKKVNEFSIEKDGFFLYRTIHRIVHINNDKGIESFNKVYLPFSEGIEMVDVKARTILADGRVMELNKENIKEIKDEEGNAYKIFAIDGLTKNCEVEYFYTQKKLPSFFGTDLISSRIPAMTAQWELITPDHLLFEARTFNGLGAPHDTSYNEKRHLTVDARLVNESVEEKYSMYDANLKRVEYKLSYNKAKNAKERLFTWNELARKLHSIYTTLNEKEVKKVRELLSDMKFKAGATPVEKIVAIENHIKKNFVIRNDISSDDSEDMIRVLKAKVISEKAAIKLFSSLYMLAGIDYQIVIGGDRSDYTLDRSFENWNNASNIMLYFPESKKFLAPTKIEYRYPWFPPAWGGTLALFCVPATIGSFTTAVGEMKSIQLEAYEHNFSNLDVQAKLESDALMLTIKHLYGGYSGANYKVPFAFFPQEEQDKFVKELIKSGTNSENIISKSVENTELEQQDVYKPLIINATIKSSQLVEKAGNKYLVKIGEIIGEQAEMYDARPRETAIQLYYPHALVRNIVLEIPQGYVLKNPEVLNFNQVFSEDGAQTMGFVSTYTLDKNKLHIRIVEDYKRIHYPIEQYNAFKKVINAAADFNKVVLILDKQ
jgi:hypothetical protein